MAVKNSDAVGGIIITASHNPVEWNALKLLSGEGLFLDSEEGRRVKETVDSRRFAFVPWDRIPRVTVHEKATQEHVEAILGLPFLNLDALKRRRFRVALDCVNGAGGVIAPRLLQALGCRTYPINDEPSGRFAHTPEPVPENLDQLCRRVIETKADIGFAVDPDVDRLAIVDETGYPLGEERTIVLAAQFMLSRRPGQVVVNLSTTRAVEDVAQKYKSGVIRTPVGEIHVARKMQETGAVVGGEGNGGVLLPELHLGRDAPAAMAVILQHLLDFGGPLSSLRQSLPGYMMVKKKKEIGKKDPDRLLAGLKERYKDEDYIETDGLKIQWPRSWVHIRKSNTEPIIRVIAEAPDPEQANALCDRILAELADQTRE
jgi:phosphomannomutase